MRNVRYLASACSLLALMGCDPADNGIDDNAAELGDSAAATTAPAMTMLATTLGTPASYTGASRVAGTATVTIDPTADGVRAEITVANGEANGQLPWHVHKGTCANDQGILGEASAYEPITLDANGSGTATATVSPPLPLASELSVNVHQSAEQMGVIVACGDLSKTM